MLEKIVADMPKAYNPYPDLAAKTLQDAYAERSVGFRSAVEAQCQLLAEQGWRKVPSDTQVAVKLARLIKPEEIDYVRPLANELHRWWLEGE